MWRLVVLTLSTFFVLGSALRLGRASAVGAVALLLSSQLSLPNAMAEVSFAEQLKVVQALQAEQQRTRVSEAREEELVRESEYERGRLIARGLVSLPAPGTSSSEFPFGYTDASTLDPSFGSEEARLILTAVSKQGPPVAAKRYKLREVSFPFVFEITTDDLLFPYNAKIWESSPLSENSISVTCILEPDGKLVTPEPQARFGFAISDPIKSRSAKEPFMRTDAKISVSLKSDGRPYSPTEIDLLSRVDSELNRLGDSKLDELK